jgi:hypothetical protein
MRSLSVKNVLDAKFNILEFKDEWLAACGEPERSGTWVIYGPPKNGKTSFAFMLAKYITSFSRVLYHPVEEKKSLTIKEQLLRINMIETKGFTLTDGEQSVDELISQLQRHKSPDVVFIDSIQFWGLTFEQYKALKHQFPAKIFVYISHVEGRQPEGATARRIWRDANIAFRIEGFRAFPVGRYGGGATIDINTELASDYWGLKA